MAGPSPDPRRAPRRGPATAGFSALELMIATVALMVMSAGVVSVTMVAKDSLQANSTVQSTHVAGKRALERLQRHLRASSWATLTTQPEGFLVPLGIEDAVELLGEAAVADGAIDNLSFQAFVIDPAAPDDLPVLSDPFAISVQDSATDPPNGVDDDQDGVVDCQDLVLALPAEPAATLCRNVVSFSCAVDGRTVEFQLVSAVRASDGTVFTYPSSLAVEIRND